MSENNSYRQIIKATTIFGGVQVFNIIVTIIRSKFIAILLGPTGIGISGLLNSTTSLISGLTNFGLRTSAVKNVAEADGTSNKIRISIIVTVLRRWVWITGLLGTILTIIFSPWLSQLTFGNKDFTWSFVFLSITLLFNQLSSGQLVVLQGLRKLNHLAIASLLGNLIGLTVSIPLYYIWGINAIVPAIIISSVTALVLSWFFSHKIKIEQVTVSKKRTFAEGKNMLIMGFMISLSSLISVGVSYLVRIFINHSGGIEQVGLYNAGFSIINTYVGMVFSAMVIDYYPRLSSVATNNELCKKIINEQAEIAILILAPIITVFLVYINRVVIILYSTKFIAINEMIHWAAMGMFFKAASWSISIILLAKGASKLFFWNELLANIYVLFLNILGYKFYGLEGLGISFSIAYLIYFVQVFIISKVNYNFSFNKSFTKIFLFTFTLAILCFTIERVIEKPYSFIIGSFIILFSFAFSYIELNKRLRLAHLIKNFIQRFRK